MIKARIIGSVDNATRANANETADRWILPIGRLLDHFWAGVAYQIARHLSHPLRETSDINILVGWGLETP